MIELATSNATLLRQARASDLDAVNDLIQSAIDTWNLPERVKRISLPLYRYDPQDLDYLDIVFVESDDDGIIGVAAWEPANHLDTPSARSGLLLHGIYVKPELHQRGIGSYLLNSAEKNAQENAYEGVLVKAQSGAESFFIRNGYEKLEVVDTKRDYPHRLWKAV